MTAVRFNAPELDGIEDLLGGLADKIVSSVNDRAFNRFGKTALRDPSEIEVTPTMIDEPVFIVRAWHETGTGNNTGIAQEHDFTFRLRQRGEEIYISTDDETMYQLTTREAFLLAEVGGQALINSLLASIKHWGNEHND